MTPPKKKKITKEDGLRQRSVKIDKMLLDRYRKLSGLTLIPMGKMIEQSLRVCLPMWEGHGKVAQNLSPPTGNKAENHGGDE